MMTVPKDVSKELADRIQADVEYFGGELPEKTAISWRGYLAAMLEWQLLSVFEYRKLLERIPSVENDPAIDILKGRE